MSRIEEIDKIVDEISDADSLYEFAECVYEDRQRIAELEEEFKNKEKHFLDEIEWQNYCAFKHKDDINLQELEKFGFEKMENSWGIWTFVMNDGYDRVSDLKTKSIIDVYERNRSINVYKFIKCKEYHETTRDMKGIDVLFDLIQAGLVEKI